MTAQQLDIFDDALPSAPIECDPWHIFHLEEDTSALCGHVFRGEVPTEETSDDETCPACLVLSEIPCACGVCSW